jgi:hypothetical protein
MTDFALISKAKNSKKNVKPSSITVAQRRLKNQDLSSVVDQASNHIGSNGLSSGTERRKGGLKKPPFCDVLFVIVIQHEWTKKLSSA